MAKMTGKELSEAIKQKIQELEIQSEKSKHPLVEAHSVKVFSALKALINPISNSDNILTEDDLKPFFEFLKQQEQVQCSVASYFMNPQSRGNQLCFFLVEKIRKKTSRQYHLLLPSISDEERKCAPPLSEANSLKGYIISDDGKHLINIKECLASAAKYKVANLSHRGVPLTDNEKNRVIHHSSYVETYYENLKKYEVENKLKEMEELKSLLDARDKELGELVANNKLKLKNSGGGAADKKLIEQIFSTLKTKNDLVSFMQKMSRNSQKWLLFMGLAVKHMEVDLHRLILDGAKSVDELVANESRLDVGKVKDEIHARQFLASVAYSIQRKHEGNVSMLGWLLSFAPTYTGVFTKQPKLDSNNVQMCYLSLPSNVIEIESLSSYAKKRLDEGNWSALFGNHTLGTISTWILNHSAPNGQEASQVLSAGQAALKTVANQ